MVSCLFFVFNSCPTVIIIQDLNLGMLMVLAMERYDWWCNEIKIPLSQVFQESSFVLTWFFKCLTNLRTLPMSFSLFTVCYWIVLLG